MREESSRIKQKSDFKKTSTIDILCAYSNKTKKKNDRGKKKKISKVRKAKAVHQSAAATESNAEEHCMGLQQH